MSVAVVAAACAMIAGWMRMVGQVTAVPTMRRCVAWAMAPSTLHTKGLWPCRSVQGWKWSEMRAKPNPVSCAI